MKNKLTYLVLFFIFSGCGKDVTVPQAIERQTSVTLSEPKNLTDTGILSKGEETVLLYNSQKYVISKYSSKMALDFIEELPVGESSVQFTGEIRDNEILITKFN